MNPETYFRKVIALPQDHGSWVFLLSPLLIGLFAGGRWTPATAPLIVAAFAAFLIRQPVTMAVKALSGRRPRQDLAPALFWAAVYGLVGAAAFAALVLQGFGYLLVLALPGLPVFAWHLLLV
ncbi:MAG TPA: YwiC-like family protein, partial [Anaerolineales bacterium]